MRWRWRRSGAAGPCPFDLHALWPVPGSILALGPDHPRALAWLWQHWGTTQALRHVVVLGEPRDQEAVEATWRLGFWSADWTPWRALSAIAYDWPQLRFETRPLYDQAA